MKARVFSATMVASALLLIAPAVAATASIEREVPVGELRVIDASAGKLNIDAFYSGTGDPESASLTVDGKAVKVKATSLGESGVDSSAVVVVDNSSTVSNGTAQLAVGAAISLNPGEGQIADVGIVAIGGGASRAAVASPSAESLRNSVESLPPMGQASLWDGVSLGASMLSSTGQHQRNLIIVSASPSVATGSSFSSALAQVQKTGATVHVVVLAGSTADIAALRQLVSATGGTVQVGTDDEFKSMFKTIRTRIEHQYRFTAVKVPPLTTELSNAVLKIGPDELRASFRPGVVNVGAERLVYVPTAAEMGATAGSPVLKIIIVVLVVLASGGVLLAVGLLFAKRSGGLDTHLKYYEEGFNATGVAESQTTVLGKSSVVQAAVKATEEFGEKRGLLVMVANKLEGADLPLRPAEALVVYFGIVIACALAGLVLVGGPLGLAIGILLSLASPGFIVDFLAKRRRKKFNASLPDMLSLLAGTLKAGYSIGQGFEAVSKEADEPMGAELRRAVSEARLGRPLDEALGSVATRMRSDDFEWAVMAIRIQREVGGNLAELLLTVADTMTQRERLRRDVKSLTAEGKMSAIMLGCLSPVLGVVMYTMNPDYIGKLFSGLGIYMLGASLVMEVIGFILMKKCITIEV
ncbi:MAG TPA: hypothetical protein DEG43_14235 [Acidimicrobiaceae bacterium]|jgi:tight adherence protein B|nr:hypothetical protein [Acidimicrobiaceae bacterium]